MSTILVVEDASGIRLALLRALSDRGHAVLSEPSGMGGLQSAVDNSPDLVVLDLGLPDLDGLQVLSMLRAVSAVPVIVVTARDDDAATVKALDAGADDYVIKPFGADQLEARIRAVLRRVATSDTQETVTVGGLVVNPASRTVTLDGNELELTRKEFELLWLLATRAGEVVTKKEMLSEIWRQAYGGSDRTVDVHMSWLRRKLGETAAEPRYLHSVRGVGVRLTAPDSSGG